MRPTIALATVAALAACAPRPAAVPAARPAPAAPLPAAPAPPAPSLATLGEAERRFTMEALAAWSGERCGHAGRAEIIDVITRLSLDPALHPAVPLARRGELRRQALALLPRGPDDPLCGPAGRLYPHVRAAALPRPATRAPQAPPRQTPRDTGWQPAAPAEPKPEPKPAPPPDQIDL